MLQACYFKISIHLNTKLPFPSFHLFGFSSLFGFEGPSAARESSLGLQTSDVKLTDWSVLLVHSGHEGELQRFSEYVGPVPLFVHVREFSPFISVISSLQPGQVKPSFRFLPARLLKVRIFSSITFFFSFKYRPLSRRASGTHASNAPHVLTDSIEEQQRLASSIRQKKHQREGVFFSFFPKIKQLNPKEMHPFLCSSILANCKRVVKIQNLSASS